MVRSFPTRRWLAAVLFACAGTRAVGAQSSPTGFERFLRDSVRLTEAQREELEHGRAVVVLLPTEQSRDVAVIGVVAVPVPAAAYVAMLRDERALLAARSQRFGMFGTPPTIADVRTVSSDASEYRELSVCRAGHCKYKLSEAAMREFQDHVDWNSPDAKAQVDSIARALLVGLVSRYRLLGNAAMSRYDDTRVGVQARDAFTALLQQGPHLPEIAPSLRAYLQRYPAARPEGARDVVFWSEDRLQRLAPTITITHLVIVAPPDAMPVVFRKQAFANHYFEAAFETAAVYEAPNLAGGPGIYVASLRRYRFDNLPGGLMNIRGRVRDVLQTLVRTDLQRERATLMAGTSRP